MFPKLKELKKHHQLIYSLLIAVGLIGIWRGIWRLFVLYLFPNNAPLSSVITLAIGIAVLAVTHHRLS